MLWLPAANEWYLSRPLPKEGKGWGTTSLVGEEKDPLKAAARP